MPLPALRIAGLASWADGLPDWSSLRAFARGEADLLTDAPKRPAPDLLAPNERRRAPDSVLLALQVAQAACLDAKSDPKTLASIFASTQGDLRITDYMCETLARAPAELSPTKFQNSVHNAAAGYWTIGCGCHAATTAISAFTATFAQALIEAATQLACGESQVLLVAYDSPAGGPLAQVSINQGMLGIALVLSPASASAQEAGKHPVLNLSLARGCPSSAPGRLARQFAHNAMSQALPLLDALANDGSVCELHAGSDTILRVGISA
jgi:hypothetical protein